MGAPRSGRGVRRGALLSSNIHAGIKHIDGKKVRATLELGYQIGYPVQVAPDGVKVTAHTPELKLTGGVNAKLAPNVTVSGTGGGGSVGEVGGELGAEATVIPAADLEFTVGAGKITTATLAEIALTRPVADIVLSVVVVVGGVLGAGGAGAETPAQRCKRETAQYNSSWKQAWVATHPGRSIDDAPVPRPAYTCGQNDDQLPSAVPTTVDDGAPPSSSEAPSASAAASTDLSSRA